MSEDPITVWTVLGTIGKGIGKTVEIAVQGVEGAAGAVQASATALKDSMAITEIITVFNATDKLVRFINREAPRDTKDIPAQNFMSMKNERTAGAYIPWFDPPRYDGFSARHIALLVDDSPVMVIWQRTNWIYWSNRLDSEGRPAKAYKMAGLGHVGGPRTLVVRYDLETTYSAFLTNPVVTG